MKAFKVWKWPLTLGERLDSWCLIVAAWNVKHAHPRCYGRLNDITGYDRLPNTISIHTDAVVMTDRKQDWGSL
jgi:hypothetical protein